MALSHLPAFNYKPLPSSRYIRVLELERTNDDSAALKAKLRDIDLDDEDRVPYAALSYTWGSPDFSDKLIIDGAVILITPNLAEALRHFREISCLKWI